MAEPSPIKKLEGILDPLIRKRYLKYFQLPQDLRQMLFAVETANQVNKIAQENKLNQNQLWWASYAVGMVLLGETNIVDFVKTLQKKCRLAEEPARQLARHINQAIFLPAKDSLKKIHQVSEWPKESETVPSPTSGPSSEPHLEGNIVDLKNH